NFFVLARRHGRRGWLAWHLLFSLRRLQLARTLAERLSILRGLLDGARGKLGANPRYRRTVGEKPASGEAASISPPVSPPASEMARRTFAMVLTHNAPLALRRCLQAIEAQSVRPAAVLVIDNGSLPPVDLRRRHAGFADVTVVRTEDNLGPAGGWALGFDEFLRSGAQLAWVLDDDILPDPDCLEVLLGAASTDPDRAFCFPRSIQPDGSVGEWGSWCGFLVARAIVAECGVPRADLFWWAEDNEYTHWRIPKAGYPRRLVDGAVVQHDAIRQNGAVPTWKYYYEARNMLYLHLHLMRRVGWYPRNVTKLLARALLREKGRRVRSLVAVVRGLHDGARGRLGIRYTVTPLHERVPAPGSPATGGLRPRQRDLSP
ncbi:MAG TPA: glycosyltransferase, partial [Acidimicrobiales bacterium]|nr:glycosyltransferase [Acidimicrobiales bacterium]